MIGGVVVVEFGKTLENVGATKIGRSMYRTQRADQRKETSRRWLGGEEG